MTPEELYHRYQHDSVFHAVVELVSPGGWVDEYGVEHSGPSIADAELAAAIIDAVRPPTEEVVALRAALSEVGLKPDGLLRLIAERQKMRETLEWIENNVRPYGPAQARAHNVLAQLRGEAV